MQALKEQIIRQQVILKALDYYHGAIDGLWGPKSIEAKRAFERSGKFAPGLPSNGLPFGKPPYPKGITMGGDSRLLLAGHNVEQMEQDALKPPVTAKKGKTESSANDTTNSANKDTDPSTSKD